MRGYLLDTNHASAVLDHRITFPPSAKVATTPIYVSATVIGELWYMVYKSKKVEFNELRLRPFLAALTQIPFDSACAVEFGLIFSQLHRDGRIIPKLDIQIAATARRYGLTVATADKHFGFVTGLQTENWLA